MNRKIPIINKILSKTKYERLRIEYNFKAIYNHAEIPIFPHRMPKDSQISLLFKFR